MNNGRMTFRFDVEKDKPGNKSRERWSGSGLDTVKEYTAGDLRQESEPLDPAWPYDADFVPVREEPPEESYNYYSGSVDPRWQEREETERSPRHSRQSFLHSDATPDLWEKGGRLPVSPVHEVEEWYPYQPPVDEREPERFENIPLSEAGYGGSYHSRRPSYWWKFALSVAGALGTGVLLGYAALSFFSGGTLGSSTNTAANTAAVQGQAAGNAADPAGAGTTGLPITETGSSGVNTIPVQVAAQSYYLLQYGVFSSADGAAQAQQELLAAGLAAGLDPDDGNRVYAGLSPDREQAKLLSGGLKNQGIELYVREVALPSAAQVAFAGKAETVEGYFSASGRLLGELSSISAALLSTGQADAAGITAVSDLHLQWTEAAKALEKGLTAEQQGLCAELEKSMSQGISALNEYGKSKANGLLWEVQGSMMRFLTGQKRLLSALI